MSALVVGTPTASDAESVPLRRTAPSIKLPAQSADEARLELVDQRLAVDPNGTIELRYLLTGLTGDPLQLVPPEPAPEPPTTDPTTDPTNPVPPAEIPEPPAPEPAPESPPPLILKITNYEPLVDPADVASVVGSDIDPAAFEEVGDAVDGLVIADARPLLTRNDDATVSLDLDIETDVVESIESRLKLDQPGIYPLRVQLLSVVDGAEQLIATAGTVIQRIAGAVDVDVDTPPPVDLSVVTATPVPPPDAGEPILDVARVRLDDAVQLAAAVDAPVTLEVPPTLIAEQTTTPAAADQLAEALADDELVALPIVPLDVSSAVAAGVADAYARLLGAGDDLLTESLPTTASRRDIWIATEPLSSSGAQLLRDLGTRFVVIPEALYIDTIDEELPPSDRFVQAELPDGGTLPFLVVDPIADQLTTAAADRVLARSTTTEWAVDTLATLLLDQHDDNASGSSLRPTSPPRRSRVLTTPDLSAPDARLIQALDDLAATTPAVRFAPASALIGLTDVLVDRSNDPVTVELPDVAGPSLSARVELVDRTGLALASAASMLADDDPRIAAWTTVLNTLISTGYTDDAARMIADDLIAQARTLTDAVELPQPFTFTLTGRSGTIEIRLGNSLDESLQVVVALDSTKVTFPEGDQRVTLRPLAETSLFIPVEAESNGTSSIDLVVSTPAGAPLNEPVTLTARVSALTGLGQVLTGGLILVLLTWWFTNWRGRRRAQLADNGRDRHPSSRTVESVEL